MLKIATWDHPDDWNPEIRAILVDCGVSIGDTFAYEEHPTLENTFWFGKVTNSTITRDGELIYIL